MVQRLGLSAPLLGAQVQSLVGELRSCKPGGQKTETERETTALQTRHYYAHFDFPGGSDGQASAYNVGDLRSIPGSGRSPGGGHSNPLQYSCLENPMDRGVRWATVHGVAKSQTRLTYFTHSLTPILHMGKVRLREVKVTYS